MRLLKSTAVTLHQGGSGGEKRFIRSNGCVRDRGQSAGVAREGEKKEAGSVPLLDDPDYDFVTGFRKFEALTH